MSSHARSIGFSYFVFEKKNPTESEFKSPLLFLPSAYPQFILIKIIPLLPSPFFALRGKNRFLEKVEKEREREKTRNIVM